MDIVQLTYSGTQIHHRVNLMHCDALGQSTQQLIPTIFKKCREKKVCLYVHVHVLCIMCKQPPPALGAVGGHLPVIFHQWHC